MGPEGGAVEDGDFGDAELPSDVLHERERERGGEGLELGRSELGGDGVSVGGSWDGMGWCDGLRSVGAGRRSACGGGRMDVDCIACRCDDGDEGALHARERDGVFGTR